MLLQVDGLTKEYVTRFGGRRVPALRGVSFGVEKGEFVAVMGESGSGKTTLLTLLAALDRPTDGRILLDGEDMAAILNRALSAFRRDRLGFIFQDCNLLDTLSLRENIVFPLVLAGLRREEMQGEKPMRSRAVIAVMGAGCLIAAYLLSATSGSSATLTSFMLALLLVILGTYGVFTGVSAEVLRRLRKGARFYEDASEFVVVSGLQHRMRKNAAGLTNICLFSCAALFTLCCSFSVLFGQDAVIARVGQALAKGQIGLNTAAVDAQEISLMFTTLAFLGVFFVLVFLACTALVLYCRQLAEGTEDAGRFRILRAVGLSDEMTSRTARQQLRVVFLLPLGGTLLHIAFAFPFFATFMGLISINAPSVLIGSVAAAMLVFCVFYLFCYKVSTRAYLRTIA